MKLKLLSCAAGLCLASSSFALNPVDGIYVGFGGGVSFLNSGSITNLANLTPATDGMGAAASITTTATSPGAKLEYNILGNFFAQLGYRWENYAAELEFLYNTNTIDKLTAANAFTVNSASAPGGSQVFPGPVSIQRKTQTVFIGSNGSTTNGSSSGDNPKIKLPKTPCPTAAFPSGLCGVNGRQTVFSLTGNFIYNVFGISQKSKVVPYIGTGVGFSRVENVTKFLWAPNGGPTSASSLLFDQSESKSSFAAQGILGFNYFLDDWTTVSSHGV